MCKGIRTDTLSFIDALNKCQFMLEVEKSGCFSSKWERND